jgi:putative ubiquitin-RnfH superfamily antitoxin RatB of RatAB toxin-antitoxin module
MSKDTLPKETSIRVEVAFALPAEQALISVSLPADSSVDDAIAASGIAERFPDEHLQTLQTGIWGRLADRQSAVSDGDRVEIYRPLLRDPRDARRELAQAGLTMRTAPDG